MFLVVKSWFWTTSLTWQPGSSPGSSWTGIFVAVSRESIFVFGAIHTSSFISSIISTAWEEPKMSLSTWYSHVIFHSLFSTSHNSHQPLFHYLNPSPTCSSQASHLTRTQTKCPLPGPIPSLEAWLKLSPLPELTSPPEQTSPSLPSFILLVKSHL